MQQSSHSQRTSLAALTLGAIGVVYGDKRRFECHNVNSSTPNFFAKLSNFYQEFG